MKQLYPCPKGHQSTDPDYCSDCGTKIDGASSSISDSDSFAPAPAADQIPCPDCGTPHSDRDGIFCEICGYNFQTQAHGEIPIPPAAVADPIIQPPTKSLPIEQPPPPVPVQPNPGLSVQKWQLEVTIDPSLAHADSPPAPTQAAIVMDINKTMNLIGRTSETRANYPDISLDFDDAISHRHAVLNLDINNTLILRDIGSSNGTYVNGIEIKPMADVVLKDGDSFNLGHWTKITVKGIA